ncbi:MAG: adenylyltransferase/cytidyltransferase family protein [Anaerolineae bacterium]|nr:adenylyltransferase/cytidyltransferase family protein [Anaerolineae bacterium]NUQ05758.1 adenylyltransferase/cytidyltransferase family protein [Anaerolineae bacterium]
MPKKVFVSGSFDLLHSGHIAFLQEAAAFGDLYVALGSDATIFGLKGRMTINSEQERLYMMRSLGCVKEAFISSGSGFLDFEPELRRIKPDLFVVNEDGASPEKATLCAELHIDYVVLRRQPQAGLPARSSTALRRISLMPYRVDLAGGWLDQPFVSKLYPGTVITLSIEPSLEFNERSGMATSTRNAAIELWDTRLPIGPHEKLAKILFRYDNPPGKWIISGSQDSIGIVYPGLARAHYDGDYWPRHIEHVTDEAALQFVENSLWLLPLGPRHDGYDPLAERAITRESAHALADAADHCWNAILRGDLPALGAAVRESFEAQIAMFPYMVGDTILSLIDRYRDQALGWKLSGAGGGGYLILVSEHPIESALRIAARRAG